MSATEAQSGHLAADEGVPGSPAPLRLGDPAEPVLEVRGGPVADAEVDVVTAWRTVRLGDMGVRLLADWLGRWLEMQGDQQTASRAKSGVALWTASGIAQEEGVARRTVYGWIERPDFPEPFAFPVGGGPVWEASRVRAWVVTSRPPRGRPPKS